MPDVDELMKRRKSPFPVIPAKVPRQARDPESFDVAQDPEVLEGLVEWAGIQTLRALAECLDPGFQRGDDFSKSSQTLYNFV